MTATDAGVLVAAFPNAFSSVILCRYVANVYSISTLSGTRTSGGTLTFYSRTKEPYKTASPGIWVVRLYTSEGRFHCSGSAIAPDWVLTANHCVGSTGSITHVKGDVTHRLGYSQTAQVSRIYKHPTHDVALLKLASPLVLLAYGTPMKASFGSSEVAGTFMGWGCDTWSDPCLNGRESLHVRTLNIWDDDYCSEYLYPKFGGLCSDGTINDRDSGGPLIWNGVIVGVGSMSITSFTHTHAHISEVMSWLSSTTKNAFASYAIP